MSEGFVAVYKSNTGRFEKGKCYIRVGNQWKLYSPFVYTNGEWQLAGQAGEIMLQFIPSGSTQLNDTNNKKFMVQQEE